MNEFLDEVYWGNTVRAYLFAAGAIILAWIILRLIRGYLIAVLKKLTSKTQSNFDDILVGAVEKFIVPFIYLAINYNILLQLNLSPRADKILEVAMIFVSAWYIIRLINYVIHGGVMVYMQLRNEPEIRMRQLSGILMVIKVIVWIMGIIMVIDNLGYNVTTVIAGLGVGGIAVALAAQNILGDLFSYIVIFLDKPFEVGDFIVMGTNSGTVEKIGIKTSHVRSPDGQQLVMPNAELVKTVIQNHKRLQRRRVVIILGVEYGTDGSLIKQIPEFVKGIISSIEGVGFGRAHLKGLGESSINFEVEYFIETSDYGFYMDSHQAVLFRILDKFQAEGIAFAYPTRTVMMKGGEGG